MGYIVFVGRWWVHHGSSMSHRIFSWKLSWVRDVWQLGADVRMKFGSVRSIFRIWVLYCSSSWLVSAQNNDRIFLEGVCISQKTVSPRAWPQHVIHDHFAARCLQYRNRNQGLDYSWFSNFNEYVHVFSTSIITDVVSKYVFSPAATAESTSYEIVERFSTSHVMDIAKGSHVVAWSLGSWSVSDQWFSQ